MGKRRGERPVVLSERSCLGLLFINRYRYLTIKQFAKASGLQQSSSSELLLRLERQKILRSFGNTGLRGHGKTPKVYYLTKKGHRILCDESGFPEGVIEPFHEVHVTTKWSPIMFHRLATIDLILSVEVSVRSRQHLSLTKTFVEYRRKKNGQSWVAETGDYVTGEERSENRIVPDAGFILENTETGVRGLFLIEADMGTERIQSITGRGEPLSILHKMRQYDRYLQNGRFAKTYASWGKFDFFTGLFVTTSDERVGNIRNSMDSLPSELHRYYRLCTFKELEEDFFHSVWTSRDNTDNTRYSLIRL